MVYELDLDLTNNLTLTPDEMEEAAKAAVAMCEEVNIDTGKVLNATNLMKVKV